MNSRTTESRPPAGRMMAGLGLVVIVIMSLSGCVINEHRDEDIGYSSGYQRPYVTDYYEYYYYPGQHVYYDIQRHKYHYYHYDRGWLAVNRLPSYIPLQQRHHKTLKYRHNRPWNEAHANKHHRVHRDVLKHDRPHAKHKPHVKNKQHIRSKHGRLQAKNKVQVQLKHDRPHAKHKPHVKNKQHIRSQHGRLQAKDKVQIQLKHDRPHAKNKLQALSKHDRQHAKSKLQVLSKHGRPQVKKKVQVQSKRDRPHAKNKLQVLSKQDDPDTPRRDRRRDDNRDQRHDADHGQRPRQNKQGGAEPAALQAIVLKQHVAREERDNQRSLRHTWQPAKRHSERALGRQ